MPNFRVDQIDKTKAGKALAKLWEHYSCSYVYLARSLGLKQVTVRQWFSRGYVSKAGAARIERATYGKFKATSFRPLVKQAGVDKPLITQKRYD